MQNLQVLYVQNIQITPFWPARQMPDSCRLGHILKWIFKNKKGTFCHRNITFSVSVIVNWNRGTWFWEKKRLFKIKLVWLQIWKYLLEPELQFGVEMYCCKEEKKQIYFFKLWFTGTRITPKFPGIVLCCILYIFTEGNYNWESRNLESYLQICNNIKNISTK